MAIAGIDPSYSSSGIVVKLDDGGYDYMGFSAKRGSIDKIVQYTKTEDRFEHYDLCLGKIKEFLELHHVDKVMLEDYAYDCQGNALVKVFGFGEMLRSMLRKMDIDIFLLSPTEVKKFATGYGGRKTDKNVMSRFFYDDVSEMDFPFKNIMWSKKGNVVAPFHDIADAYWILKTGIRYESRKK